MQFLRSIKSEKDSFQTVADAHAIHRLTPIPQTHEYIKTELMLEEELRDGMNNTVEAFTDEQQARDNLTAAPSEIPSSTKNKRRRVAPAHRWTHEQTRQLVEAVVAKVKGDPEAFEKPVSHKFYGKIAENNAELAKINWNPMKNKMRYLKVAYMDAVKWRDQTGAGLLERGEEKSVGEHIEKICPFFNALDKIFAQTKAVNSSVLIESSNIEALSDSPDESFIATDVECEAIAASNAQPSTDDDETQEIKNKLKTQQIKKRKINHNSGSINLIVQMQEKKFELELKKFEWTKEKDQNEAALKRLELAQQMELKRMEIERDERLALAKMKLEYETEEKIRKYELDLKYKK